MKDAKKDTSGTPSATLARFAATHSLRMSRSNADEWQIRGKAGCVTDAHQDGKTLLVSLHTESSLNRWWSEQMLKELAIIRPDLLVGNAIQGVFKLAVDDLKLASFSLRAICSTKPRLRK